MQAQSADKGFMYELQRAYAANKQNLDAGSTRLESELGVPGLRSWKGPRYA